MTMRKIILPILSVLFLLSACGGQSTPVTATDTITPTITLPPTGTFFWPTRTPVPTSTYYQTWLARKAMTATAGAGYTPTASLPPGISPAPVTIPEGALFYAAPFTSMSDPCKDDPSRSESPMKRWTGCQDISTSGLVFVSTSGQGWRVDGSQSGLEPPVIVHWEGDERYAYFATRATVDSPSGFFLSYWEGLFRLDLTTGTIDNILPGIGHDHHDFFTFSYSPTGRRWAYVLYWQDPRVLAIQDLKTGEVTEIVPDRSFDTAGGFRWSPDGLLLAVLLADNQSDPPRLSVMVVNIEENTYDTVMNELTSLITMNAITDDGLLTYTSQDDHIVRQLDITTGQYTTIGTVTPSH